MNLNSYKSFIDQFPDAIAKYPDLRIKKNDDQQYLKGILDIGSGQDLFGSFSIELKWKEGFPYRFPILFEVGDDIPTNIDWHKYSDQSLCITVNPDEIMQCKNGITINRFIKEFAIPHLSNQLHRKKFGKYLNGEYSHGLTGVKEFYAALLKTSNQNLWVKYFEMTFGSKSSNSGRNQPCFCGSNQKYKNCHAKVFEKLMTIGRTQVYNDFKLLLK